MSVAQILEYLAMAGGIVTVLGTIVAVTRHLTRVQAQIDSQKLKDALADSRREVARLSDKVQTLGGLLAEARKAGEAALFLRLEIDEALSTAKLMLDAQAASILVPYPLSRREELIFLAVDSPNASKLSTRFR